MPVVHTTSTCRSVRMRPMHAVRHACWDSGSIATTPSGASMLCRRIALRTWRTSVVPASRTACAHMCTPIQADSLTSPTERSAP